MLREGEDHTQQQEGSSPKSILRGDHASRKKALKISKRLTPRSVRQDRRKNLYTRSSSTAAAARTLFDERRPTSDELEDFFSGLEDKIEVRKFIDRYNFDIVHDVPLPGRFEWIKVQE